MKTNRLKICFFLSTTDVAGGANRSFLDLLTRLQKDPLCPFDFTVIIRRHGPVEKRLAEMGITCHLVNYDESIQAANPYRTFRRIVKNCLAVFSVCRILRKEKVRLLHNNSLPATVGMSAAQICRIPYVCHVRENVWAGLGMKFYFPSWVKHLMRHTDSLIFISEYIKKTYSNFAMSKHATVLNDGLNVENYYLADRSLFSEAQINLMILGVINPQKGQKEAVKALEILMARGWTNLRLHIVGGIGRWNGSTEYYDNLKNYVKANCPNEVQFHGVIEDLQELRSLRLHTDINLICSSAEGLGRTTIESMLSGSLTIAANAGATPELIESGRSGLLYQSGSPEDLADKLEWAINNKEDSCRIASAGQQYALSRFSIEQYAPKIAGIYRSLLEVK